MRRILIFAALLSLSCSLILIGCGEKKAVSSRKAIDVAKSMETVSQKTDYLIGQAKAFYNSKEFREAIDITQYILRYVDKDSQVAKDLLEKAKDALTSAAESTVEDVKRRLPGFRD
jgi:hypothetical protein